MPRCQLTISPYVTKLIPEPRGCVRVLGVAGAGRQRHQRLAVAVTRQAAQERILRDLVALQVAAVAAAAISCCSGADGKPVSAPDDQQQDMRRPDCGARVARSDHQRLAQGASTTTTLTLGSLEVEDEAGVVERMSLAHIRAAAPQGASAFGCMATLSTSRQRL